MLHAITSPKQHPEFAVSKTEKSSCTLGALYLYLNLTAVSIDGEDFSLSESTVDEKPSPYGLSIFIKPVDGPTLSHLYEAVSQGSNMHGDKSECSSDSDLSEYDNPTRINTSDQANFEDPSPACSPVISNNEDNRDRTNGLESFSGHESFDPTVEAEARREKRHRNDGES